MSESGFYLETEEFDRNFGALVRSAGGEAAAEGLFSGAQALLDASDDESPQTPYKTGELRASRQVLQPEISEDRISVTAGFNKKYAARMHEGEPFWKYTATQVPSPGPKFLEEKMAGNARRFMAVCADRIRRKLGGSPR